MASLADKLQQARHLQAQQNPPQAQHNAPQAAPRPDDAQIDAIIASDPRWQHLMASSRTARPDNR